jgi:hypothetical protein
MMPYIAGCLVIMTTVITTLLMQMPSTAYVIPCAIWVTALLLILHMMWYRRGDKIGAAVCHLMAIGLAIGLGMTMLYTRGQHPLAIPMGLVMAWTMYTIVRMAIAMIAKIYAYGQGGWMRVAQQTRVDNIAHHGHHGTIASQGSVYRHDGHRLV